RSKPTRCEREPAPSWTGTSPRCGPAPSIGKASAGNCSATGARQPRPPRDRSDSRANTGVPMSTHRISTCSRSPAPIGIGCSRARMVVDRFVEMFDRFRADTAGDFTSSGPLRNAGVRLGIDDGEYQRLQTDVQRALESYLAVLRRFSDASLLFFDATRSRGGS